MDNRGGNIGKYPIGMFRGKRSNNIELLLISIDSRPQIGQGVELWKW